jgi:hypothetical protein
MPVPVLQSIYPKYHNLTDEKENLMQSIYRLQPLSDAAEQWVNEHVQYESYQMMGPFICIEARYVSPIIEAMLDEGFKEGEDFNIF